jgi:hypothetical protein
MLVFPVIYNRRFAINPLKPTVWFTMLAALLWAVVMGIQVMPYKTALTLPGTCETVALCKQTGPIASLELATSPSLFQHRIDQGSATANRESNARIAQVNTWLDFLFIVLYWSVFVQLARAFPGRLASWVVAVISIAALLDVGENYLLFKSIGGVVGGSTKFLTPGIVSHFKWSFFAVASLLLSFHLAVRKPRTFLLIAIPMLLSSLFTFAGQFFLPLLGGALLLLVIAFVAALIVGYPYRPQRETRLSWLNYLYFIRVSITLWLVMPVLALIDGLHISTAVTLGILTPETSWQLFYCSFFLVLSGWVALTLARIVCAYGEERFGTPPPRSLIVRGSLSWKAFLAAQLPGAVLLARIVWNVRVQGMVGYWFLAEYLVLGVIAAFAFWVVIAILYYWTYQSPAPAPSTPEGAPQSDLIPVTPDIGDSLRAKAFVIPGGRFLNLEEMEAIPNPPLARFIRRLLKSLAGRGEGYERPGSGGQELHSGHCIALFLFFGIFTLYIGLMTITAPLDLIVARWIIRAAVVLIGVVCLINYVVGNKEADASSVQSSGHTVGSRYRWLSSLASLVLILFGAVMFWQPRSEKSFPVVASILVVLLLGTSAFAGLAFWADRYRIPVLTIALVLVTLTNLRGMRVDHQFEASAHEALTGDKAPPTPTQVLKAVEPDKDGVRPLIIVTSTGGGIHAAMWTAEILSLLEKNFPSHAKVNDKIIYGFHDSILLTSTVSGGSVGMMAFLKEYRADRAFQRDLLENRLVNTSSCSSLEAVAWGLIYPDLARLLAPGLFRLHLLPVEYDRGVALEQALNKNFTDETCHLNATLNNAAGDIGISTLLAGSKEKDSTLPAFTMNTTAAETGDRFLLSNYQIKAQNDKNCDINQSDQHSDLLPAVSFLEVYGEPCVKRDPAVPFADLNLSTAARLSASFTYVSPAARIDPKFAQFAYHFVDGGYYDNDGTGSVLEFLRTIDLDEQTDADKRVHNGFPQKAPQPILLIEIRNGPDFASDRSRDSLSCQLGHCTTGSTPTPWGPWRQLTAPAQAMYLAGHESVTQRNRRELCLLEDELKPVLDASNKPLNPSRPGVLIHHVVFPYRAPVEESDPALSWHLTARQIKAIRCQMPGTESCPAETQQKGDSGTTKSLKDALVWFQQATDGKLDLAAENRQTCRVFPN